MSEKWTKGPWETDGVVVRAGDIPVCVIEGLDEDAALVAAAPDMAQALSALVLYVDGHESRHCGSEECRCGFWSALGKARAALSKARGES